MHDEEEKARIGETAWRVTRCSATEPPFSGRYWNHHEDGVYHCICCGAPLFDSNDKFDSGTGWPSYSRPVHPDALSEHTDTTHGMIRTEVRCAACDAHLGHVFPDGPPPTGLRYCINSAALEFRPRS